MPVVSASVIKPTGSATLLYFNVKLNHIVKIIRKPISEMATLFVDGFNPEL